MQISRHEAHSSPDETLLWLNGLNHHLTTPTVQKSLAPVRNDNVHFAQSLTSVWHYNVHCAQLTSVWHYNVHCAQSLTSVWHCNVHCAQSLTSVLRYNVHCAQPLWHVHFCCISRRTTSVRQRRGVWGGSKGVINFPWIFYAMQSLVPVGHFRNIYGLLFTWLVCGSFQWRHGLLFTDCIVWYDKDKVIGFKRSHWIHLGWWSTGFSKLQLFQLSQHSHVTNCRLISSSAYFPWNMTLKYKMQLPEGSWDKILLSRGHSVFPRKTYFSLAVCLSKRYTKVPEVVFATSF